MPVSVQPRTPPRRHQRPATNLPVHLVRDLNRNSAPRRPCAQARRPSPDGYPSSFQHGIDWPVDASTFHADIRHPSQSRKASRFHVTVRNVRTSFLIDITKQFLQYLTIQYLTIKSSMRQKSRAKSQSSNSTMPGQLQGYSLQVLDAFESQT